ncbi:alpha-amylase family glycosyl hydrolase [Candidatus Rhodoluna planktonica]|uniref:Sucrose phosphorylase n=1 Tax=Candidatus Rhodoluna planktonica TaxID=535712 RepID=A0A1D9E0I3_9MICO|nr:alpha-amylase family glycosyl hydrolase [Candidatus Rhodoluna planktonica]AOY56564.1 sucrose phosphorylase [Candidatus Rhodoluna planktonica]
MGSSILVYAERVGGNLGEIEKLLHGPLSDFDGIHVLPFFHPYDGDDAGFDPIDHKIVDPRLGTWADFKRISETHELTADLIVNHASNLSPEFLDWQAKGAASDYDGLFLTFDVVFPNGATEEGITSFYRPRPGMPFTAYEVDGKRRLVWTTFMPSQVDIDIKHPQGQAYLRSVLDALASGGVKVVRLDAVGYAVKTPGTDSFMTAETLKFVEEITELIHSYGMRVLVEVHAHYTQQLDIAPLVDLIYDFQTAPLLLHSYFTGSVDRLDKWFAIRPNNCLNVLDTHDGYGVIDGGPIGERPGLITQDEMANIFRVAEKNTNGHSAVASVIPQWFSLPHQINATLPNIVANDTAYVGMRAVQFFLPGEPQVYYVGLFNGMDDQELFRQTGQGRDVNRHNYTPAEISAALQQPVTQAIIALARVRKAKAFGGSFDWQVTGDSSIMLKWTNGSDTASLEINTAVDAPSLCIKVTEDSVAREFCSVEELAKF